MVGAKWAFKPPRKWTIRFILGESELLRDRASFGLATDIKLHSCNIVKIKIDEVGSGRHIPVCIYLP